MRCGFVCRDSLLFAARRGSATRKVQAGQVSNLASSCSVCCSCSFRREEGPRALEITLLLSDKMEFAYKIVDTAKRAANNNTLINVCLVASFATLGVRSMNQQKTIEDLEAEKESLVKSNKSIRKTIWDWKQHLYAEASTDSALVPLERLKAIYGDAPPPQHGDTVRKDATGLPKIMI